MPAFVADGQLTELEARQLANHVLDLSQGRSPSSTGARLYADTCAACHGDKGQGDPAQGAPRLADGIWLYGGTREAILAAITNGRRGVMPPWESRLDEATIGYFKGLSEETGVPYQTLINLYLRDCATSGRKLSMRWQPGAARE